MCFFDKNDLLAFILACAGLISTGVSASASDGNGIEKNYASRCGTAQVRLFGNGTLPNAARHVVNTKPLLIVVLGFSFPEDSATDTSRNIYADEIGAVLRGRFPGSPITVISKIIGDGREDQTPERLPTEVFNLGPTLILWEAGRNDAIRRLPAAKFRAALLEDAIALQDKNIDLIFSTPRHSPAFVAAPDHDLYLAVIRDVAFRQNVLIFPHFRLTQSRKPDQKAQSSALKRVEGVDLFVAREHCVAKLLADAVARRIEHTLHR